VEAAGGTEDARVLAQRIVGEATERESGAPLRAALVSAKTGEGIDQLLSLIDSALTFDNVSTERFEIPLSAGGAIALLHRSARVLREEYNETTCDVEAEVP